MIARKRVLIGVAILFIAYSSATFLLATVYHKRCSEIQNCPMISEGCGGDMLTWDFCTIQCTTSQNPPNPPSEEYVECERPMN